MVQKLDLFSAISSNSSSLKLEISTDPYDECISEEKHDAKWRNQQANRYFFPFRFTDHTQIYALEHILK